ncbi:hypothetical protein [Ottowia sp.]|uniref:hypothetical protein n=1 Tax=Ottowia sp. TaxID=1898956 RepID=UPI002C095597|nr:hypothetical protein [Ottowia sp.]HOB66731.1 hypothetical protein [Ottowia sp.]HPZ58083.1 hypothetical protein [Ottowia sp.]HQD48374.1 hypothetical protein [Ottowia sp.]
MATHHIRLSTLDSPDFQDTVPAGHRPSTPTMRRASAADDALPWLSPQRLVVFAALAALIFVLVAAIASVAQAQVRKGNEFRLAQHTAAPQTAAAETRRANFDVAALGPVAALSR